MGSIQDWMALTAEVRERRGLVRHALPTAEGMLDFASNDYLGLSLDPRVREAGVEAIAQHGAGARASRVVTGTLSVHEDLEAALCRLTGQPAALACSTGYAANLAVLTALSGPDVLIAHDEHVHASVIDGARMSRSSKVSFPHADLAALDELLAARTQRRAIVVVESVYSVLGDVSDLPATIELCTQRDALLVVDEAHGIGVLGDGRGGVHAAGLAGREDLVVTLTLSKALGSMGGAVLGSPAIREHLTNVARPFIFDTALAPGPAGSAAAAARIIMAEPRRVARLNGVAERIALAVGVPRPPGPIVSIPIGRAEDAARAAGTLRLAGMLVACFRPPSVPDGVSRLRLTARSTMGTRGIEQLGDLLRPLLADAACATSAARATGATSSPGAPGVAP